MTEKPTYEELKQRVSELEREKEERLRAEEALEESEKKYRTIFENAVMGIYQTGIDGEILMLNEKCAEIFGYESPKQALEAVGNVRDVFARPEDRSDLIARINKKGFAKNEEIELKKRNGDLFRANLNVIKDEEKNGRTVFTGILEDVTDLRRAEEALRSSEEKYRLIFNSAPIGICHYNQNSVITDCNPQFAEMAGTTRKRLLGFNMLEGLTNEYLINSIKEALSGKPGHIEGKYTSVTGHKTIYAGINCAPIASDEKTVIGGICVVEDTTKKVKAEKALMESREQLRKLSAHLQTVLEQERKGIAREIHDDLGQVLTAVKMDAAWLKEKIPKDEKGLIEKAAIIVEIADQAIRSVQKISSRLRPAVLDDLGLVAAIEWMAKGCQNRTGIVFDVQVDPEEMDVSPETATAAFRIFQEAVTNIARHSKATQVKVSLKLKKNHIELIVSDNGIGITGWQGSDREAFGLLGMRERARSIGGEIRISGIPGKGTEVAVSIPAG